MIARMYFSVFLFVFLSVACQSTKIMTLEKPYMQVWQHQTEQFSVAEKIEILPGQKIHIATDEAGIPYIKILPGDFLVFKYTYQKKPQDKNLMDAAYVQYVYFELPDLKKQERTDDQLKEVKLIVETAGFRNRLFIPVEKGLFQWKKTGQDTYTLHIKIDPSYAGVLQKEIKQTLKF